MTRPFDWAEFERSLKASHQAEVERHSKDMPRPVVLVSHVEGHLFRAVRP